MFKEKAQITLTTRREIQSIVTVNREVKDTKRAIPATKKGFTHHKPSYMSHLGTGDCDSVNKITGILLTYVHKTAVSRKLLLVRLNTTVTNKVTRITYLDSSDITPRACSNGKDAKRRGSAFTALNTISDPPVYTIPYKP